MAHPRPDARNKDTQNKQVYTHTFTPKGKLKWKKNQPNMHDFDFDEAGEPMYPLGGRANTKQKRLLGILIWDSWCQYRQNETNLAQG